MKNTKTACALATVFLAANFIFLSQAGAQNSASEIVKKYHGSLVFVTGKEGSGSGFIAEMGGANFLFTNAHVTAEIHDTSFKNLDGAAVQGGAPSVAVGRDIFRMAMPAGGKPLEIMQNVEQDAAIGDEVAVLGNAEGEGVINTIKGKITGIGPDVIEISAPFVPGNSGSPIIHLKTGKVVGIATYIVINTYDALDKEGKKKKKGKAPEPTVRRFGCRLDNVKSWQTVDWNVYSAQATGMKNIEDFTSELDEFFRDMLEHKGKITPGKYTNPAIKTPIEQWLVEKSGKHSAKDTDMANANFFSSLKTACQADVTAARPQMTYDYFQRELAGQQQVRDEMSKALEHLIKSIPD